VVARSVAHGDVSASLTTGAALATPTTVTLLHPIAMRFRTFAALSAVAALSLIPHANAGAQETPANTLSAAERKAGWTLLFDGATISAWRGYKMADMPPVWKVVDGTITKVATAEDIVTREQYGDFEFSIDWKIALRGNSGIFYRATENESKVYWSAHEYQLAEDSLTPDSRNIMTSVGAVYGFYPSKRGVVKPAGEWNSTRIVCNGPHVEHWLNGVLIAQYEMWSPEWNLKLHGVPGDSTKKPLKFAPFKDFGMAKRGYLAIQGDHNGTLSLRNIKIREIK
jgi:hypothetical protein